LLSPFFVLVAASTVAVKFGVSSLSFDPSAVGTVFTSTGVSALVSGGAVSSVVVVFVFLLVGVFLED